MPVENKEPQTIGRNFKGRAIIKIIGLTAAASVFALYLLPLVCYAAPCYGTRMPQKNRFFSGLQTYTIFKRYLENNNGKVRSFQNFLLLSYGICDWLAVDLKGGAGNIKQRPVTSGEIDYPSGFSGGYGFRVKLYDRNKMKSVLGFQHISVHPKPVHLGDVKHKAVLDDWQFSLLISREFAKITPYMGARWSRVDYIHWIEEDRKRVMSDLTKSAGLILGFDLAITNRIWLNLEGQLFDSEAAAFSLNFSF